MTSAGRALALLLTAATLGACAEDDDPAFTLPPPTMDEPGIGPGTGFGNRDRGVRDLGPDPDDGIPRDAAPDRGALDRGALDRGADDGLPDIGELSDLDPMLPDISDLPRDDTGVEPACERAADCDLAVQLDACDPCPIAATVAQIDADRCLARYVPGATLGAYAPADCWAACGDAAGESCLDGPIEAVCEGAAQGAGRCVPF